MSGGSGTHLARFWWASRLWWCYSLKLPARKIITSWDTGSLTTQKRPDKMRLREKRWGAAPLPPRAVSPLRPGEGQHHVPAPACNPSKGRAAPRVLFQLRAGWSSNSGLSLGEPRYSPVSVRSQTEFHPGWWGKETGAQRPLRLRSFLIHFNFWRPSFSPDPASSKDGEVTPS